MKKSIAFIFTHGPHGNVASREGLDVILSISAFYDYEKIGVFFISDGILLLLPNQQPKKILAKNLLPSFRTLSLYEINLLYLCADSVKKRGFDINSNWILHVELLSANLFSNSLSSYDHILTF